MAMLLYRDGSAGLATPGTMGCVEKRMSRMVYLIERFGNPKTSSTACSGQNDALV